MWAGFHGEQGIGMKTWFKITLWKRILGALVVGAIAGVLLGENAASIKWIGDIFIRLIRMIVIPLIFTTLVSGVMSMGDPRKIGSIGLKTFGLYLGTTAVAIVIGLTLATIIQPGVGVDVLAGEPRALPPAGGLREQLMNIFPTNVFAAFASNNKVLSVIFFALIIGVGIMLSGEKGKPLGEVINSGAEVVLKVTHLVMEVAPFGVFALIAYVTGTQGVETLFDVLPLAGAIVLGCLIQIVLVHGSIMLFLLRLPPIQFFKGVLDAQMLAFSSSSSSATLPISMAVAKDNLGIKRSVASSVLPLGSTINMDGTAIYVGIVAVFTAQALDIDLTLANYLMIALTTTLVSVGSAGIPSASLFLLAAVLGTINVDAATTALVVGFLFPFDRPLDMCRTVVNVTGDLSVATIVAKSEGELDEVCFRTEAVE